MKISLIAIVLIILITLLKGWSPIFEVFIEVVGLAVYLIVMVFIAMFVMVKIKKLKK